MAISKQEFYEGAALHRLVRGGKVERLRYDAPFFRVNDRMSVLLKYSTRSRSPWGFTFTTDEQRLLKRQEAGLRLVIGLVCGADGVAAFSYEALGRIIGTSERAAHVSCYRKHRERYEVTGPEGALANKVAPAEWNRILDARQ